MTDRRLAGWIARDLEAHLDQLAAAARGWREGASEPSGSVVTLHLASGHAVTGRVLGRGRQSITLQGLPQRGTADVEVSIVAVARIEALTFHAAQELVAAAEQAPGDVARTSLELKRRAKALADKLAGSLGKPIAVDIVGDEVAQLAPVLELLRVALERVCADELGRAAFGERVQRIAVRIGASPRVALASGTLDVEGPLPAGRLQSDLDALL